MKIKYIIYLLLVSFSCNKNEHKPLDPPYFKCLVNGEYWVAQIENNPIFFGEDEFEMSLQGGDYLRIVARREIESKEIDQIFFLHCTIYNIDSSHFLRPCKFLDYTANCKFEIDTLSSNSLIITEMNSDGLINSGIFNLTMISSDCNDTLEITEGKFER